jgi:hypothetical protein
MMAQNSNFYYKHLTFVHKTTYLYTQWLKIEKIRSSKVCKVKLLNIIELYIN